MIIDLEDVRDWLKAEGQDPDVETAWKAAEAFVSVRCSWVGHDADPPAEAPADLQMAVSMMTRRLLGRRDAWNGMIALTDETVGRIGVDRDIQSLMGPHRRVVLA